jgi:hypothetical protein
LITAGAGRVGLSAAGSIAGPPAIGKTLLIFLRISRAVRIALLPAACSGLCVGKLPARRPIRITLLLGSAACTSGFFVHLPDQLVELLLRQTQRLGFVAEHTAGGIFDALFELFDSL